MLINNKMHTSGGWIVSLSRCNYAMYLKINNNKLETKPGNSTYIFFDYMHIENVEECNSNFNIYFRIDITD